MMASPGHIRAFVAVEINDAVRAALVRMQRRLALAQGHVSWTRPENIHCTLLFLGDVPAAEIPAVADAVAAAAAASRRCAVEAAGLGCFGPPRAPRIIWAGLQPADPLAEMQRQLCRAMPRNSAALGEREKAFHPHLTIGRVRSARNSDRLAAAIARNAAAVFGALAVERICLMESRLGPGGPVYAPLRAAPLAGLDATVSG